MAKTIRHFDTERQAKSAKRKYQKYKATRNSSWSVQGNSLVRVKRR